MSLPTTWRPITASLGSSRRVTISNEDEGFASAVERFVLPDLTPPRPCASGLAGPSPTGPNPLGPNPTGPGYVIRLNGGSCLRVSIYWGSLSSRRVDAGIPGGT